MTTRRDNDHRDRGNTLLEILVAVMLLGSVGVGVLTSLAAAATGASVQRSIATAQSWLATASDAIAETPDEFRSCLLYSESQIRNSYQAEVDAVRTDDAPAVEVVDVAFWNGMSFDDSCGYAVGHRLQQVELRTVVGDEVATVTVVTRPSDAPTVDLGPLPATAAVGNGVATIVPTPGLDGP